MNYVKEKNEELEYVINSDLMRAYYRQKWSSYVKENRYDVCVYM